jgi:hydroxymethylpyrimidine/phosphomethylpyrimidine kinase
MSTVLTIAGSDSSGGAGIQADLRTFAAYGVHGATAITAITAQNATGITAMFALEADLVTAQIESAIDGTRVPLATKIGMLATAAIAEAVAAAVEEFELPFVVLDPVLASTSGTRLLSDDGVQTLLLELMPRVFVITPNIPEAEALSGVRIASPANARDAAMRLHEMGAQRVIIKGGHDASRADAVVDLLYDGHDFHECRVPRAGAANVRGTGCSYASAVAASLALGQPLLNAASEAQRFVAQVIGRTRAAAP